MKEVFLRLIQLMDDNPLLPIIAMLFSFFAVAVVAAAISGAK